jgi:hypothetical protein
MRVKNYSSQAAQAETVDKRRPTSLLRPGSAKKMSLMPKRDQKRCVHCGQVLAEETRDHVFPKSWYPETATGEIQRWTVPSCDACNNKLGGIEKVVFNRLALCVDPRKAASDSAKRF